MTAGIVSTIGQKCKRCYSCIRECPAKAIRVINGQAVVIEERCISCGHCVKVCSQHAKNTLSDVDKVLYDLLPSHNTVAVLAPSFVVSFPEIYPKVISALRKIGFKQVVEVAFGADLVAKYYESYFEKENFDKTIISSPCPAIFNFIEKYYVDLVPNIAEVVSPMVAIGRYLKKNFGSDTKVVFIGPCIAKKDEYKDDEVHDAIDSVITFIELKEIFELLHIELETLEDSSFDPPYSFLGKSFPLTGGLLKTANINNDILEKKVIIVDGKDKAEEIIVDIFKNKIKNKFVDILFCEGCINGPAIDSDMNYYSKREALIDYIESNNPHIDKQIWLSEIYNNRDLDLSRKFRPNNQRRPMPSEEKIREILARTNKFNPEDELNCGSCGYPTCREYAVAIAKGLAEEDMCLNYLIDRLESAYSELKNAQEQLQSAEKLASIGQLAAGVAHEINNPLGTIMLYANMLIRDVQKKGCNTNIQDIQTIIEEANRCKNIVSNLLNFARHGKLKLAKTNIHKILEMIVKGIKLKEENSDIIININNNSEIIEIEGDSDQLKQVFINLISNAVESLEFSVIKNININLRNDENNLIVDIIDTGCGIPQENMSMLFTPFFTTKKMGRGTGLGLAISYGIIKMHKGDIKAKSSIDHGSTFTVKFPIKQTITKTNLN
ncbi:MAG: 4Fe-4S dicluster domain-containing protein [Melioribacteraceae bacterium]|jgi:signal transduction histidine kinase/iron only hydrogenase large subunit-like protein|nr:4Fe-4S dicluster domain-containing protein [Melioribacteraceae bacterium]